MELNCCDGEYGAWACVFGLSCRGHIDLGPPKDDACDEHNDNNFEDDDDFEEVIYPRIRL